MSKKPVFKSYKGKFLKQSDAFVDFVFGHMALDIEIALKSSSGMPVDTGQMKAATRHFRDRKGKFRVEIDKEYASVQEAGIRKTGKGAPTRIFTNYTTAGTGAGFFAKAIAGVTRNKANYLEEGRKAVGL